MSRLVGSACLVEAEMHDDNVTEVRRGCAFLAGGGSTAARSGKQSISLLCSSRAYDTQEDTLARRRYTRTQKSGLAVPISPSA